MEYEPETLNKLHYITPNLIITDRVVILTQDVIDTNNISLVIGFFEERNTFYDMILKLNNIAHNVVEYGLNGNMDFIDFKYYEWLRSKVESIVLSGKNVLCYCDNDFTTSIPFITYYMTTVLKEITPTIYSAVDLVLTKVDDINKHKYMKRIEDNALLVLITQVEKKVVRREFKHQERFDAKNGGKKAVNEYLTTNPRRVNSPLKREIVLTVSTKKEKYVNESGQPTKNSESSSAFRNKDKKLVI
jgi:hypothetical protein